MAKRFLSLFLVLATALGLTAMPGQALAAGQATLPCETIYREEAAEPGALTGHRTESLDSSLAAAPYGKLSLNPLEQKLYNTLKNRFTQIANGELDSSIFKLDTTGQGITGDRNNLRGVNTRNIILSLLMDCPFETYWMNKSAGQKISWRYYSGGEVNEITIEFAVFAEYARTAPDGNSYYPYQPDPGKTRQAAGIARNAQKVVEQYSRLSDYDKLTAYRDYICDQVEYNHYAAEHDNGQTGNPWQLIYVFDNDPATNVVCEGYAKAFKYLCDLSDFRGDVECYLVEGVTSGPHMWNLVRIDGKSYMADVTNCDSDWGPFDDLFLAGAAGATGSGFTIQRPRRDLSGGSYLPAQSVTYTYGDSSKLIYDSGMLTLAPSSYTAAEQPAPTPAPTPTPAPAVKDLEIDFSQLEINQVRSSHAGAPADVTYTLGSAGADMSVLVIGAVDCGKTLRTLETVKAELADLGVRNAQIYLLDANHTDMAGLSQVRQYVRDNPSYVRVSAVSGSEPVYGNLFWQIVDSCRTVDRDQVSLPAVCVLDQNCRPVYCTYYNFFDRTELRGALAPYAGAPFSDVEPDAYYVKAVNWAVSGGITTGATDTTFSPKTPCTQAEILTFLWRAVGKPAGAGQIPSWIEIPDKYGYAADPVKWAFEEAMLVNLNSLSYGGLGGQCTRAQAMQYIWEALGRPEAAPATFSDVPGGAPYADAVSWAAANGVANGTGGGRFSPDTVCDRGTIVTFLHRAFVEEARIS